MKNLLLISLLIALTACSSDEANVSCSDSDTTELVMDIS